MQKMIPCRICGKLFDPHGRQLYCSNECRKEAIRMQTRERNKEYENYKICKLCGKLFNGYGNQKYCSEECKQEAGLRPNNSISKPRQVSRKEHKSEISSINAEARKNGMTYGQYQAMLFLKGGQENGED